MAEMKLDWRAIFAAGLFAAILAGTTPGLAGFAFKAPSPDTSAPPDSSPLDAPIADSAVPAVPVAPVESDFPAPVAAMPAPSRHPILEPAPVAAAPMAPSAPSSVMWNNASANNPPHIRWEDSSMQAHKVPGIESGSLESSSKDVVSGFGSDLPLQVALQQVVPPQYKVSLAPDVDSGVHVSWRGGKPWRDVLADMLAPVRFSFTLQGDALMIKRGGSSSSGIARAGSSKMDMIPDDMISSGAGKAPAKTPAIMTTPMQDAPSQLFTKSQQKQVSPPIQEADVLPLSAPVSAAAVPASHAATIPPFAPVVSEGGSVSSAAPGMPAVSSPVTALTSPTPAAPASSEQSWHAEKGQTLKTVLQDWAKAAHVKLYWATDYDYKLTTTMAYTGSFEDAVNRLFEQFNSAKPQPFGELHKKQQEGNVLIVNTYGTFN
jgi:hypothetical protein